MQASPQREPIRDPNAAPQPKHVKSAKSRRGAVNRTDYENERMARNARRAAERGDVVRERIRYLDEPVVVGALLILGVCDDAAPEVKALYEATS